MSIHGNVVTECFKYETMSFRNIQSLIILAYYVQTMLHKTWVSVSDFLMYDLTQPTHPIYKSRQLRAVSRTVQFIADYFRSEKFVINSIPPMIRSNQKETV